jgi:hydrogenase maturation protease
MAPCSIKWCAAEPGPAVVIGYGNELRGDDAAGPRVARAVAALGWVGVRALDVHQLTPELAELLAGSRAAIFVDASVCLHGGDIAVERIEPSAQGRLSPHASEPRSLLALAQALYGRCPPAWLVTIPGCRFELGAPLSPLTERAVAEAVARLPGLVLQTPAPLGSTGASPV